MKIERYFTKEGQSAEDVYNEVAWGTRSATIKKPNGEIVFEQKDVLFPTFWSDRAVSIVASKYFQKLLVFE